MQRIIAAFGLAGALALGGCAATAGQAAGTLVGGTVKAGLFGAKYGYKGATLAGRTVYGAAKGVHEEFSKPKAGAEPDYVKVSDAAIEASQH